MSSNEWEGFAEYSLSGKYETLSFDFVPRKLSFPQSTIATFRVINADSGDVIKGRGGRQGTG